MWLSKLRWSALLLTFLSLAACAREYVYVTPVTPVPVAREVVVIPHGYESCRIVPGRWVYGGWVPPHRVCHYTRIPGRVTWVEGYWTCMKYSRWNGQCHRWVWRSPHWSNRVVVY